MGSGFSSFVFRLYAKRTGEQVTVVSVDDSSEWLDRTRAFLEDSGLSADGLVPLEALEFDGGEHFDLVLHDLGGIDLRAQVLPAAIEMTGPRGLLILDDVHRRRYRASVRLSIQTQRLKIYNLKSVTEDHIGRYALALRHSGS
jgi:predicted O-methyltransferase YrrM